jgi:hypothetical protein
VPRQFSGRLIHNLTLQASEYGEIYMELYLNEFSSENQIGLYRLGTRVLKSITELDEFKEEPWTSGYLQGIIDVPYLQLTPGTRDGIIRDSAYSSFINSIGIAAGELKLLIEEEKKTEEETVSRNILKSIQKALKEAFLMLPKEEYDWLEIYSPGAGKKNINKPLAIDKSYLSTLDGSEESNNINTGINIAEKNNDDDKVEQKNFFEFPGPLHNVMISPASSIIGSDSSKKYRAIARDKNKRNIDNNVDFLWEITEGDGSIDNNTGEIVLYTSPKEPGITILKVTATQNNIICTAESIITVTGSIIPKNQNVPMDSKKGLPEYTFKYSPGELWRSNYDESNNLIVINNGHADYIFASKNKIRKLRYICKLYAKELVLKNFIGLPPNDILERMIELSLYTEENLK